MKNTALAWSIFVDPKAALAALEKSPRYWFPILAVALSSALALVCYYNFVDFAWLTEHMISSNPKLQQMSEAQRVKATGYMSKEVVASASVAGALVVLPGLRLLEAVYYLLAGRVTDIPRSFQQWLTLSSWSSLPAVIATIVMALFLLLHRGNQVSVEETQILSLNELFFHAQPGSPWYTILLSLTILQPWMWWLSVMGVRQWSGRTVAFSTAFVMLPVAVVYGCWVLIALSTR
jgi:hypothetical protein